MDIIYCYIYQDTQNSDMGFQN